MVQEGVLAAGDQGALVGCGGRRLGGKKRGRDAPGPRDTPGCGGGHLGAWLEVVAAGGDDVADAAAGVVHVAEVARDHVQVEVGDGLPAGSALIEADVVAVGGVLVVEQRLRLGQGGDDGLLFGGVHVAPGGHVTVRGDQQVSLGDREGVADRLDQRADEGDAVRVGQAEGTGLVGQVRAFAAAARR